MAVCISMLLANKEHIIFRHGTKQALQIDGHDSGDGIIDSVGQNELTPVNQRPAGVNDVRHVAVPLARIVLAPTSTPMLSLTQEPLILAHEGVEENEVAEIFDKYNLQTLPVVDERNMLKGVITSDDVISMLRAKL